MPGNKTKEQNDEGWRQWYSDPSNKNKYLRKKLLTRISKGDIVKLSTLRKYGLLEYYKKETTRANKRKIKEQLMIEPLYYAKPDPLIIDGEEQRASIGQKASTSMERLSPVPETFSEEEEDNTYEPEDEVVEVPKEAPPETNTELLQNTILPTNKRKATKILREKVLNASKTYKVKKNDTFTFRDAFKLLNTDNLNSLNQMKEYKEKSLNAMKSRLKTIMRLYKDNSIMCEKGLDADVRICLGNAKTLFKVLKNGYNLRTKSKGFKGWKDFMSVPVILANASPKFSALLGKRALQDYRKIMLKGIDESQDKQDITSESEVIINWNVFKKAFEKEEKKFKKLKTRILKKKEALTIADKRYITDFLLFSMPYLGIPRRDDHGNLLIVDSSKDIKNTKTQNYYLRKSRAIWLHRFKTDDKYDPPQIFSLKRTNVGKEKFTAEQRKNATKLGSIIEDSLKMWERKYVITKESGKKYSGGKLSERLPLAMRNFGVEEKNPLLDSKNKPKKIGYNTFRHSYATYIREIDPKTKKPRLSKKQLRNTAKQMLHSDAMNEKYLRQLVRDFNLEV